MSDYTFNRKEEREGQIKSGIITALIWLAILLFVFTYSFTVNSYKEPEQVQTMLINFGDNRNGNGIEEPAEQEGSLAATTVAEPDERPATVPDPADHVTPLIRENKKTEKKDAKILTGNNEKAFIKKSDKTEKATSRKSTSTKETGTKGPKTSTATSASSANSKTGHGDGKGNAAIGNFIKGKGTKAGSQGTGTGIGNAGDPLGGEGNGDSRIGVDRKLIAFIPGTMGRGGVQPANKCTASGTITISYVVDKAGHVTSARRLSGSSDPCIVSTTEGWVKKYVKAEKAGFSSKGTYKITF